MNSYKVLPVNVAENLAEQLAKQSGLTKFAMRRGLAHEDDELIQAMTTASQRVWDVRHPDEPSDLLASFVSGVDMNDDFVWFWADISDMEGQPEVLAEVIKAIVTQLAADNMTGTLDTF